MPLVKPNYELHPLIYTLLESNVAQDIVCCQRTKKAPIDWGHRMADGGKC